MSDEAVIKKCMKDMFGEQHSFNPVGRKAINPMYLQDLMTIFCWLDEEHQSRACSALNSILQDQMAESKGVNKAI